MNGSSSILIDFALFVNGNRYAIEIRDEQKKTQRKKLIEEGWKIRWFFDDDIHNNLAEVVEEIKRLC